MANGTLDPNFGLATLLAPLTKEKFFAEYWPERLFVNHDEPGRLAPLLQIPELADVASVAKVFPDSVIVYLPPEVQESARLAGARVRPEEALDLYEKGGRLQFDQAHQWLPMLAELGRRVERELALPARSIACSVFAMPPGAVVEPHFDTDPAISVQIQGRKRWTISRESPVPAPLHNYVLGTVSPTILNYYSGEMPEAMPADAHVIEMEPGSVLHLPRGFLHATLSHDHSLSVTIEINVPTWSDVLVEGLRQRLTRSEAWRGFALGVAGDSAQKSAARDRLALLLADTIGSINQLLASPDEIVLSASPPLMPGPRRRYQARKGARVWMESAGGGDRADKKVCVHDEDLGRSEIEIPPDLVPLCQWIIGRETSFLDVDAWYAAQGINPSEFVHTVTAFIEAGALEAIDP